MKLSPTALVQPTRYRAVLSRLVLSVFALAISTQVAKGQGNYYWDGVLSPGGTGTTAWNAQQGVNTNWSSSPTSTQNTSIPPTGSNIFFYQTASGLTNTLGANFSINSLTFLSSATSAVTIGGTNTLTITGATGITLQSGAASGTSDTLNTNITIGSSQTWSNQDTTSTATTLVIGGVIAGGSSANLTLSGVATAAGAPANGGFIFQSANTYSGQTILSTLGTQLTLNNSGSILNTSAITLGGGTVLTLDNTNANVSRIASTQGITSNGATFNLIGNAGTPTTQTVGTLTLGSGQSYVNASGTGAALTFGSGTLNSLSRSNGGGLNFSVSGGANVVLPKVTTVGTGSNAIIGGWATLGNINSSSGTNALDFAALNGSNQVVAATYNTSTTTSTWAGTNVKQNSTVAASGTLSINSLYLTGAAIVGTPSTATTLTIGSGGIISNAATGSYALNGNYTINQAAELGTAAFAAAAGSYNANFNITSSTSDLVVTTASNLQINAAITGSIGLTKDGSGILDISNGNNPTNGNKGSINTYTGSTTVNGGTLLVANDQNFGAVPGSFTANNIILNGGTIQTTAGFNFSGNRGITLGNGGGTLSYIGGATWNIVQPIAGTGSLTVYSNPISTAGGSNTINLNPSGTNTYTGSTVLEAGPNPTNTANAGNVILLKANVLPVTNGVASALTVTEFKGSGTGVGVINFNGFSQTAGSLSGNAPVIGFNGGTLTIGSNNLNANFSGSLTSTINNTTAGNFTVNAVGSSGVTKVGTGIQTFSGINNYSGATQIQGGTLLIGNGTSTTSTAAVQGGSTFSVSSGATLGGNGTISGAVNVSTGGSLAPAMSNSTTNTLSIGGNLTLASGSILTYNFGAAGSPGTGDLVQTTGTGNITLNGTTDILNVNQLAGFGVGTYTLLSASGTGTLTDNVPDSGWAIHGTNTFNYAITHTSTSVILNVTPGSPSLTWQGSTSGVWQVGGPSNWTLPPAAPWANGDIAVFDDTGAARPNVTVTGAITANSLTINAATTNYSLSGTGTVTVTADIQKNNSANFTISNAFSSSGAFFNGGNFIIASGGSLTPSAGATVQGGTLTVNGTGVLNGNIVITSGTLAGTGTVNGNGTLSGVGQINLSGAGNITGTLGVTGGSWSGTGSVGGVVTVSGGTLSIGSGANLTAAAGLMIAGGNVSAVDSTAQITAPVTVNGNGGALGAAIVGAGSSLTLASTNTGTFQLTNVNTYGGGTNINGGILQLGVGGQIPTSTALVLPNTAGVAFDLNDQNQSIVSLSGGGAAGGNVTTGLVTGGTLTLTGNVAGTYAGSISGLGGLALGSTATGTLQLTGTNSYTGATTINGAATLQAGAANVFSPGSTVVFGNVAGATLDLNSFNQTIGGLSGGGANGGAVTLGTGNLTISGAATTSFAGTISGSGTFTLANTNTGSLTLTNPTGSTISGAVAVNGGSLFVNNTSGSGTGTGAVTVAAGATIGGSGFIVPTGGSITIAGTVVPGSSTTTPGTLTLGSVGTPATVALSGAQNELITVLGTSTATPGGSNSGATLGQLVVNGTYNATGSVINLSSTAAFNGSQSFSWDVATATGGVTGLPTLGTVSGTFAPFGGSFKITEDANNIYVSFLTASFWTGTTSNQWSTGSNWTTGATPGSGGTAVFNQASPNTTVVLGGVVPIKLVQFDLASAPSYTIGSAVGNGDAFKFDAGGGLQETSTVTTLQTVNANIQTQGALSISNSGTGGLTIAGNIVVANSATGGLITFSGTNASSVTTVSGSILAGAEGGNGIAVSGLGTVVLSGTNTYTGLTTVNSGTLVLSGNNSGLAGGITLNAGQLNVNSATALGTGTLNLAGGTVDSSAASPVVTTTNQPITLGASLSYGGSQSLNLGNGAITQAGATTISINGASTLTFAGNNAGGQPISASGAGTGAVNFTGSNLLFGTVSNSGAGALNIGGVGGTVTTGAVTGTTGSITIGATGATVSLPSAATNGTGTVNLAGNVTVSGALTASGGVATIPSVYLAPFTINGGVISTNPGAVVTATGLSLGSASSGQLNLGANSSLTVNSATAVNIGYSATATTASGAALVNAGTGASLAINVSGGNNLFIGGGNNGTITGQPAYVTSTQVNLGSGTNTFSTTGTGIIWLGNNPTANGGDGDHNAHGNGVNSSLSQTTLNLGSGANNIFTATLNVGGAKTPGTIYLANPGVLGSSNQPTQEVPVIGANLTITGVSGDTTTKANLNVGYNFGVGNTNNSSIGVLDTTGGTLNATLGTVTLGFMPASGNNPLGGASGSWVLGVSSANNVTLDTLNLTNSAATTASNVNGVFSLNGGTVTFNSGTGTGIVVQGNITQENSIVNLNGGTLNLNGTPIGSSSKPISDLNITGGTLLNATDVYVGTTNGVTQTGGTISVTASGTNTYLHGAYTVSGGDRINLDSTAGGTVTVTVDSLNRSLTGSVNPAVGTYSGGFTGFGGLAPGTIAGTLTIIPVQGSLGTNEVFHIAGTLPSTFGNQAIIEPWVIARSNGTQTASADFTTLSGNNVVALATGSYAAFSSAGASDVALLSSSTSLSSSASVYALKVTGGAAITDSGTNSISINGSGLGTNVGGLILDGGSIAANGGLSFGSSGAGEASIYTSAQNGTISAAITAGALTTFGPGKLTLSAATNTITNTVNVNFGTLNVSGGLTAAAVNVNNGSTLTGLGTVTTNGGTTGISFGPGATFAPGNGGAAGITNLVTGNGNVSTAVPQTSPGSLAPATLGYGNGISPTNVVGSVFSFNIAGAAATGAANSGLSNGNTLGSLVGGFNYTSTGTGVFNLNAITTVSVTGSGAALPGGQYSYDVGNVPTGSAGSVTNAANFAFTGTEFANTVSNESLVVSNGHVFLNFTVATPEPAMTFLIAAFGLAGAVLIRRKLRNQAVAAA